MPVVNFGLCSIFDKVILSFLKEILLIKMIFFEKILRHPKRRYFGFLRKFIRSFIVF